jgi:hypothetical protein
MDWNAILGLSEYVVTIEGWPCTIPVAAASENGAIAKARSACAATRRDMKWLTAPASAVQA